MKKMKKNVFIVSSTPRENGNSDLLAEEFARGARDGGHNFKKVNVRNMDLKFCIGCMACQRHGKCVHNDGMNELYDEIQNADVLVFATPIYFYEMAGQLKTFLDRLHPLYLRKNKFKDVYLLATAAENAESALDGAVSGVQGWIDCFDGVKLTGVLRGIGIEKMGEIKNSSFMAESYQMGKSI